MALTVQRTERLVKIRLGIAEARMILSDIDRVGRSMILPTMLAGLREEILEANRIHQRHADTRKRLGFGK
jgi:hypothetical protein